MELYFYPEKTEEMTKTLTRGGAEEGSLYKLTEFVKRIKEDLEECNLPKWEVSLKGYIEVPPEDYYLVEKPDSKPQ